MQVCPPAPSLSVCGVQGVLRMNQEVEVRPGIITKDAEGRVKCIPVFSRVVSLFAEQVGSRAWLGGWDGMGWDGMQNTLISRNRGCSLTLSSGQARCRCSPSCTCTSTVILKPKPGTEAAPVNWGSSAPAP